MDRTALPPGTRLGELEIVRVLAVGGFGIVYLARDHALDRDVAVKEFMPMLLAARGHGQRVSVRSAAETQTFALGLNSFIDEARLLARLSHPAIVKVYRFWKANGTGYMAMPYMHGPTLGDVRRSMSEPPTETWLRKVTEPLLDALAMLHAEGYYHRDIAPDNVLVSNDGLPVLLDFGAARRVIADRTQSVTAIVKPRFAPIEQYAEARLLRQGPWTDLYALGALVAYLLDGVPPPAATARAVHDEMATLASRKIRGVSTGFLAAIDWALAVRPQDRPQNVAELRHALAGRSTPPRRRRVESVPPAGAEAEAEADAPTAPGDAEFPITQRLELPVHQVHGGGFRRARWGWSMAAMTAIAAMAVMVAKLPFDGTAVASSPPSTRPALAVASPPAVVARSEAPKPGVEARAPLAEDLVKAPTTDRTISVANARPLVVPAEVAKTTATRANRVKATRPGYRRYGPEPKATVAAIASPRSPGPVEVCADRNFFVRTWCVQRRCEEPRFKGHPQCEPRQVANLMY
ncbi:MAG TPA: protein kinase [Burkholderiaceae bacterium]|nr:protein kinase [Burkholderiaceae bacterium]